MMSGVQKSPLQPDSLLGEETEEGTPEPGWEREGVEQGI
jgi:hypothetical protein